MNINGREMDDVRECFRLDGQYKLCPDNTCIHANDTCYNSTEAVQTGSGAATEPLRKCYISESSDSRDDSDRFPVRAKTYYRKFRRK
ncbi:hypothetical protein MAR_012197 [Mya arenaria]|uniref:Uncharacterized protein n=1 Tax=Mya arenaria TaxID=6604 RepID=A0ABY7FWA3_MYAAR|nr:hypothetical protein MAR_012197 [Mya arenaria]